MGVSKEKIFDRLLGFDRELFCMGNLAMAERWSKEKYFEELRKLCEKYYDTQDICECGRKYKQDMMEFNKIFWDS